MIVVKMRSREEERLEAHCPRNKGRLPQGHLSNQQTREVHYKDMLPT